jgi:hypothetical protein
MSNHENENEKDQPVPAYRIHSATSYVVKCIDDSYPEDWEDHDIYDWVEIGKWYRIMAFFGSSDISFAELIIWDMEVGYVVQPAETIVSFPSDMFALKDAFILSNN